MIGIRATFPNPNVAPRASIPYMFRDLSLNGATVCWPCVDQETFLKERIKVNGKTNNFGTNVAIERSKSKVVVSSEIPFSKRYNSLECMLSIVNGLWYKCAATLQSWGDGSCVIFSHSFKASIF